LHHSADEVLGIDAAEGTDRHPFDRDAVAGDELRQPAELDRLIVRRVVDQIDVAPEKRPVGSLHRPGGRQEDLRRRAERHDEIVGSNRSGKKWRSNEKRNEKSLHDSCTMRTMYTNRNDGVRRPCRR
jgi:hypothetical protein